jgi:hypothetical protein
MLDLTYGRIDSIKADPLYLFRMGISIIADKHKNMTRIRTHRTLNSFYDKGKVGDLVEDETGSYRLVTPLTI